MEKILYKKNKAYALMVGVGQRAEDSDAMAISARDAEMVGNELLGRAPFLPKNVKSLLKEAATKANIIEQLDSLAATTKDNPAEMVIIYFSGHGHVVDGKYYIICRDTINKDLEATALHGSEFVNKLQAIQTDRMLVLLDCCHSGGMYDAADIPFDVKVLQSKPNRVVLSASHGSKLSYLSKPVSIFTYALLEGLAGKYFEEGDTDVTVFGLALYLRERVYPLSESKQRPYLNILQDGQTGDFLLVNYPKGEPREPAFDSKFSLLDGAGKAINTDMATVRDEEFRKEFAWMIVGNDNVVVGNVSNSTVTINKGNTTNQTADNIFNIGSIGTAKFD